MKNKIIQERLNESLAKHNSNVAIECGNRVISYRELENRSNHIANWILNKGIKKQTLMGILIDDPMQFIVTVVGILKAGCVFMPLDPTHPDRRLEIMILSTATQFVISDQKNFYRLVSMQTALKQHTGSEFIRIDDIFLNEKKFDYIPKPGISYTPEDSVYIYFTSGTTGTPRAIVGKNKGLLHFIKWEIDTFGIDETIRVSQLTSPGFDAILRDIFVPLCSGGTICCPPREDSLRDPGEFTNWLEESGVHLIHCVPSLFRSLPLNDFTKDSLKNLKFILFSGERIHPSDLVQWYDTFDERIQLVNLWGTSETTLAKTCYFIRKTDINRERIPIGKPIKGAVVIILDKYMNVCDEQVPGKLYIRTPFRTLGYLNDPQLTNERFIRNPFSDNPDDLLHITGDLGKLLTDGNLDLTGRTDRQLKIRGIRIEPGEIESLILKHPAIKEAVVIKGKNETLFAYITRRKQDLVTETEKEDMLLQGLKQYLMINLPSYMVPTNIVIMEKIPRTANGKVDYNALDGGWDSRDSDYHPPANQVEKELAEIWSEILQVKKIDIKTHFFILGGNSLNIMTLINEIHKKFNVRLTLREIFENLTIEKQAKIIIKTREKKYKSIKIAEKKEYYALSSAQKKLYFLQQIKKEHVKSYNLPSFMEVEGKLDMDRVKATFEKLIQRHEVFRTSFEVLGNAPVQKLNKELTFGIEYHAPLEKGNWTIETRDHHMEKIIDGIVENFIRPFDLSKVPLLRVGLLKVGENKYIFMFDMHHIIFDGSSQKIFIEEFMKLYDGEELPSLRLQYKDYSEWQNSEEKRKSLAAQETFWLEQYAGGVPILNLPIDYARYPIQAQAFAGNVLSCEIVKEDNAKLKALASAEQVSLYMILLAIVNVLLAKVCGQEIIVVGTAIAGRVKKELEGLIGPFANLLVLKNFPSGEKTFIEFLLEIKKRTLEAFDNQEYQFEELVEKVAVNRELSRNPLYDVAFVFQNFERLGVEIPGLKLQNYKYTQKTSKLDLMITGMEIHERLFLSFQYDTKIFKEETIQWFIRYFKEIVCVVSEDTGKKLSELGMVSGEEVEEMQSQLTETLENE